MNIWSTADGGGSLVVSHDFTQSVPVYESFCTADRSACLFTAIEPGFMAPPLDVPPSGLFRLVNGTTVRVEIVAIDAGLALNVNGNRLAQAGESALLGTMPTIHVHPAWQVVIPGTQVGGELHLSYKVTASAGSYAASDPVRVKVVSISSPDPTATPLPTATPIPCAGDCNADGAMSMNELLTGVRIGLEEQPLSACDTSDANGDGLATIEELGAMVNRAHADCALTPVATFAEIQDSILTPKCATRFCHDAQSQSGNLALDAAQAYDQLVNVEPNIISARDEGLLRVVPLEPQRSFLLTKIVGPPPAQGSRMPLGAGSLSADEIDLIRRWILQGAMR